MSKIRVLIGTPLKGDVSPKYFQTALELLGRENPLYQFSHVFLAGTCVFGARDQLAMMAIDQNHDILLQWDSDLRPTVAHFKRLLEHMKTNDFVCMPYSKREHLTHWHFYPVDGADILETGLWEMEQAAIGFSAIKTKVFKDMMAKFPERGYWNKEQGTDAKRFYQFFPWEVHGPNTAEGKLAAIQALAKSFTDTEHQNWPMFWHDLNQVLGANDYSKNKMIGEDYGFCKKARAMGVRIFIDAKMVVQHVGECEFPIPSPDLVQMVSEEWRQDYFKQIRENRKP